MAGASSFAAITDWLHDLDEQTRDRLGFDRAPTGTTVWRLLTRLDAEPLGIVLAGWLTTRARIQQPPPVRARRYRQVIAVDGKTLRGARRPDGRQVHLLSALDTSTVIVLAQVTVDAKSNEISAFTPLLDAVQAVLGTLDGILFVADALHTQTGHANLLAARGAQLMTAVKGNQPKLFAHLKALPWAKIPVGDRTPEPRPRTSGDPHRQSRHPAHPRRYRFPARAASRPDHPHPHYQRKDQPRYGLPDCVPARRRRPARRSAGLDPLRIADRKSDPSRQRCDFP